VKWPKPQDIFFEVFVFRKEEREDTKHLKD